MRNKFGVTNFRNRFLYLVLKRKGVNNIVFERNSASCVDLRRNQCIIIEKIKIIQKVEISIWKINENLRKKNIFSRGALGLLKFRDRFLCLVLKRKGVNNIVFVLSSARSFDLRQKYRSVHARMWKTKIRACGARGLQRQPGYARMWKKNL